MSRMSDEMFEAFRDELRDAVTQGIDDFARRNGCATAEDADLPDLFVAVDHLATKLRDRKRQPWLERRSEPRDEDEEEKETSLRYTVRWQDDAGESCIAEWSADEPVALSRALKFFEAISRDHPVTARFAEVTREGTTETNNRISDPSRWYAIEPVAQDAAARLRAASKKAMIPRLYLEGFVENPLSARTQDDFANAMHEALASYDDPCVQDPDSEEFEKLWDDVSARMVAIVKAGIE